MASTRAQQAQLLKNSVFVDQVTGALIAAATNVLNEDPATANHQNRVAWANAIYLSPAQHVNTLLPGLLSNATLAGEAGGAVGTSGTPVPDADMDFVIASLFNAYATQYAAQNVIGAPLVI